MIYLQQKMRWALVGIIGLMIASCQQQRSYTPAPSGTTGPAALDSRPPQGTPSVDNEVRIGLLLPLTGAQSDLGHMIANAVELGFLESSTPNIKLLPFDTSSTPDGALQAIQQALGAGAKVIVGPLTTTETKSIQGIAPVPILSLSNDRSASTDQVFTFGIMPHDQVTALLTHLRQKGVAKLAIFAPKTTYGALVGGLFQSAALPGESLQIINYSQDDLLNPEFVGSCEGQNFQGFVLLEAGQNATALAALLAYKNLLSPTITCYGLDNWRSNPEMAHNPHFEGATFAALEATGFENFRSRYYEAYGLWPHAIAGLGYDAIRVALNVMGRKDVSVTTGLSTPDGFIGVYGPFHFLPTGVGQRQIKIYVFQGGQAVLMTPSPKKGT